MKFRRTAWACCLALGFLAGAGCGVNSTFVYKPGAPAETGSKLPVKVAVLPFQDGTGDFTQRGSIWAPESLTYNLAKAGIGGSITALTPDLWAKSFADDMTASGAFQGVRFIYSASELADADIYIEGTVQKVYVAVSWEKPSEFALGLRALRKTDNRPVWAKEVTRAWKKSNPYDTCGKFSLKCEVDLWHAEMNRAMQAMFAEARTDLLETLASSSGGRAGEGSLSGTASPTPSAPESVESTIEGILKGK